MGRFGFAQKFAARGAVREAIDKLPSGLCFYEQDGMLLLANQTMKRLCRLLCGAELLSGLVLERAALETPSVLGREGFPRQLVMRDGSAWTFSLEEVDLDGRTVKQLSASDTTELKRKNDQIAADIERLKALNERMRVYTENVANAIRSREVLEAKIRIHDELGHVTLATSRYLEKGEGDPQNLLDVWKLCLGVLRREVASKGEERTLDHIAAAGEAIGVHVVFKGALPELTHEAMRLVDMAAGECLTNAVRHATATELYVTAEQRSGYLQLLFSNNGVSPTGPVLEGGGLGGLRKSVEAAGGCMAVEWDPGFELTVLLPL